MAVNVLYDVKEDMAVLYCSTADWAIGPVFYGYDADEKAVRFRDWFASGAALERAQAVGIRPRGILGADGDDVRDYDPADLERLYGEWRAVACGGDGNLLELVDEDEPIAVPFEHSMRVREVQ